MSVVLSEHLPLLASAPNGIQKLRGLILELAVRGKLVPQDASKKEDWRHGSFGDFFSLEYGDNLPAPKRSESGEYPVYGSNGIVGTHNECCVKSPCIVVGRKGSAGALNRCLHSGCWVTDVAYYCVPPTGVDLDFAFRLFHTLGLNELGKGIKPGLSRSEAYVIPVAIPPLPEQHRIVAKVDELMALCDRLEQEVGAGETAHAKLVETLLGTLTQSTDAADLAANWQRLAAHFDTLFTTDASIDAIKQTVLQLAVMGKLVPQDPNDEPASELLKKIAKERAKLEAEGKIKKPKTLPPVGEGERPFDLPDGWEWLKFGTIVDLINGDRSKNYPNREEYAQTGVAWINTGHIEPDGTLATEGMHFITRKKFDSLRSGKIEADDLVYCLRGATFGKTAFVTPYSQGAIASSLVIVRPHLPAMKRYLFLYLTSPFGRSQIFRFDNGSAQPNLSANSVTLFAFPLPPLAEQHRIVAKVDELMALCDRLKADLVESRSRQERLASTLIDTALLAA